MPFATAINNAIILSAHNGYVPFIGSIGISDGRIAWVGEKPIAPGEAAKLINAEGSILMPGLVNAHCHGDMTLARGLGDDLTLLEQNEAFADTDWFSTLIDEDDRFYSRQLTYCEALLSGTTFINENMYWSLGGRSAAAMLKIGINGALSEDVRYDFTVPEKLLSDREVADFANQARSNGLVPVLGGLSEEDYAADLLQRIEAKRARFDMLLTCHLSETDWRVKHVTSLYDSTPIEFLARHNCLNEKILGSHVVWTTANDLELLAAYGVKVVNTPLCEMKIADGIARIPEMVQAGICVSLGTDGAMWNNSNDIFREMKGMLLLHTVNSGIRSLSVQAVLDMATINGAKTFGLGAECGSIEVGRRADLILINTEQAHFTPLRLGSHENVASLVVYNATGRDVSDVFVSGNHVVECGNLMTADLTEIRARVTAASAKIAAGLGEY